MTETRKGRTTRRERLKRDHERAAPLIDLTEPVALMPGSKIKVLGGTAEALKALAALSDTRTPNSLGTPTTPFS
jgi:hypothetical protein